VLFKHGPAFKLTRERENLRLWEGLRPGLTPGVKAFLPASAGREATLILEYVPERNLQTLFMENAPDEAFEGLSICLETMAGIWRETRTEEPSRAGFARQAERRLTEAGFLYPNLIKFRGSIGNMEIETFAALLSRLAPIEEGAFCPFSMRVHGDFNLSNVLYDPKAGKIHVLDLHRSDMGDYVQDASVMLVSILRLPIFSPGTRGRLNLAASLAHRFFRGLAHELGDGTYEARLAFGLARSFLSSTRFVLEERLAKKFVARARYLMEKLLLHAQRDRPWEEFSLDGEALRIDPS
jgi:hypothetical protein